jgi:hypothetical protein
VNSGQWISGQEKPGFCDWSLFTDHWPEASNSKWRSQQASTAECTDGFALLCGHQHRLLSFLQSTVVWLAGAGGQCRLCSVSFFILLSGFVLAYNYAGRARAGKLDRVRFWKARFTRLYPIYLLSLLLEPGGWWARSMGATRTGCSGRAWC